MSNKRKIIKLYRHGYKMQMIAILVGVKEAEVARVISEYSRLKKGM